MTVCSNRGCKLHLVNFVNTGISFCSTHPYTPHFFFAPCVIYQPFPAYSPLSYANIKGAALPQPAVQAITNKPQ